MENHLRALIDAQQRSNLRLARLHLNGQDLAGRSHALQAHFLRKALQMIQLHADPFGLDIRPLALNALNIAVLHQFVHGFPDGNPADLEQRANLILSRHFFSDGQRFLIDHAPVIFGNLRVSGSFLDRLHSVFLPMAYSCCIRR